MSASQYYPCIENRETFEVSQRVGPAMPYADAIDFLIKHYPRAWQHADAYPQPVTHRFFATQRHTETTE